MTAHRNTTGCDSCSRHPLHLMDRFVVQTYLLVPEYWSFNWNQLSASSASKWFTWWVHPDLALTLTSPCSNLGTICCCSVCSSYSLLVGYSYQSNYPFEFWYFDYCFTYSCFLTCTWIAWHRSSCSRSGAGPGWLASNYSLGSPGFTIEFALLCLACSPGYCHLNTTICH